MKAFIKSHKALWIGLVLCIAVIVYAACELNAMPRVYQRVFLPEAQTATDEESTALNNQYLRDLMDKAETAATALEGSCDPMSLYALGQPATISSIKQNRSATARLVGIDENYLALEPFSLYGGRYIYPEEYLYGQKVALIDEQLAVALFQYAEPLLEEIRLDGVTYRIIGIVRDHKQVGDEQEYSLYVPYRSLIAGSTKLTAIVYEAAPIEGAGGWAAFQSAAAAMSDTNGTTVSLTKEVMNAKMPLRLLLVLFGGMLAFFLIRLLNRVSNRLLKSYRRQLESQYAVKLIGWLVLRIVLLAAGYAACVFALARLFVVLIAPVYTFPEWVPAVLVEPSEIAKAFWNVWQPSAAAVELRTSQLMRIRFYKELMGWACGLCGILLGLLWGRGQERLAPWIHEHLPRFQRQEE